MNRPAWLITEIHRKTEVIERYEKIFARSGDWWALRSDRIFNFIYRQTDDEDRWRLCSANFVNALNSLKTINSWGFILSMALQNCWQWGEQTLSQEQTKRCLAGRVRCVTSSERADESWDEELDSAVAWIRQTAGPICCRSARAPRFSLKTKDVKEVALYWYETEAASKMRTYHRALDKLRRTLILKVRYDEPKWNTIKEKPHDRFSLPTLAKWWNIHEKTPRLKKLVRVF